MNWLTRLKKIESAPVPNRQNRQKEDAEAFAGFAGTPPAPFEKTVGDIAALVDTLPDPANDAALPDDADTFAARLALLTDRGLSLGDAETIAHRLALRDAERDERRVCVECLHLSGTTTARRCSQWRVTGMKSPSTPAEQATILQRCAGFTDRLKIDRPMGQEEAEG